MILSRQKTLALVLSVVFLGARSMHAQTHVHTTAELTVEATMGIYRAAGNVDGSDGIAPVDFSFAAGSGTTIIFPAIVGEWTCQDGEPHYGPDGETSGYCLTAGQPTQFQSVGTLAGYKTTDFVGALVGVFLEDTLPLNAPRRAPRFYVSDSSDGGYPTEFKTFRPGIGEVFFIGDGLTGTGIGEIQRFQVPPNATHLYLGYIDNCRSPDNDQPGCYSDNVGSVKVVLYLGG